MAESEVEEILLLKLVQSAEARKPFEVLLACEMRSVVPEIESGADIVAVFSAPTPSPSKIPVGVVEPVPPLPMPSRPVTCVPRLIFPARFESERQLPPTAKQPLARLRPVP